MRKWNWGLFIALLTCVIIWTAFGVRMYTYYHG